MYLLIATILSVSGHSVVEHYTVSWRACVHISTAVKCAYTLKIKVSGHK